MKLDVKRRDDGMVEIHVKGEDGKITVYLCEDSQAAVFKLAQLLFQMGDDPKENRRSILVGEFMKREKKSDPREKVKDIIKELKKAGYVPAEDQKSVPFTVPYIPQVDPNLVPIGITPGNPISIPGTVPPVPVTVPGTGTLPYTITWGSTGGYTTTTGTTAGTMWVNGSTGQLMYENGSGEAVAITEKQIAPPVGMVSNSGDISNCYFVSATNWVSSANSK